MKKAKVVFTLCCLLLFIIGCTPQNKYAIDRVEEASSGGTTRIAFRGIALGSDISEVEGLVVEGKDDFATFCTFPRESMRIGNVPLSSIRYVFFHNKLATILIQFPCDYFLELNDIVSQKYGSGEIHDSFTATAGSQLWRRGLDAIILECKESDPAGNLWFIDFNNVNSNRSIIEKKARDD